MKRRLLSALIFAALLGLEIWIALYVHDRIVRPYLGDVLAVICVYFLARVVAPRMRWLSIPVTLFAFCVEAVQLTGLSGILPEPFYSQENMTRLRNSVAQMEATGGTVHEVDIDRN